MDLDAVHVELEKARGLAPGNVDLLFVSGSYWIARGDMTQACASLKKALAKAPNHPKAKNARVTVQGMCN
jgi:Flp pilus assembly protein TadD